jgi:hypothetical protein
MLWQEPVAREDFRGLALAVFLILFFGFYILGAGAPRPEPDSGIECSQEEDLCFDSAKHVAGAYCRPASKRVMWLSYGEDVSCGEGGLITRVRLEQKGRGGEVLVSMGCVCPDR